MNSVGRILRSARERQGRAVAEIADELCLTQQYLRAIEEDDVKSLPGTFFYKNFVRQYAAIVGVKEAEIRTGIEALAAAAEEPVLPGVAGAASGASDGPDRRRLQPPLLRQHQARAVSGRTSGRAAGLFRILRLVEQTGRSVRCAKPRPLPAVIQTASPARIPDLSVSGQTRDVQVTAEAATSQTTVDGINQVVLNLSATEKTWLSITSEGKRLFSGFLEPSQTKTLTGLDAARMTVGNAGGIEVRLNGKPIGPIGKSGQVRVVVFTPDNFEVLPLDPPATPSETL